VKKAAQDKKEKETLKKIEKEVETIGEKGLEKKADDIFKAYKEQTEKLKTKTTVTEFDQEVLETARNEYMAVKKAKTTIALSKAKKRIELVLKEKDGLEKIEKEADKEIDNLRQKQNKKQEFRAEEDLELEIETQNTKVDAMITGLKELI